MLPLLPAWSGSPSSQFWGVFLLRGEAKNRAVFIADQQTIVPHSRRRADRRSGLKSPDFFSGRYVDGVQISVSGPDEHARFDDDGR